jgi:hypothetical protein
MELEIQLSFVKNSEFRGGEVKHPPSTPLTDAGTYFRKPYAELTAICSVNVTAAEIQPVAALPQFNVFQFVVYFENISKSSI